MSDPEQPRPAFTVTFDPDTGNTQVGLTQGFPVPVLVNALSVNLLRLLLLQLQGQQQAPPPDQVTPHTSGEVPPFRRPPGFPRY